ncbi:alpha/beta hydrolase [Actinoplanes sp. TRM 88003]|uniref:Alpha/beta hydrolase n=1 Tax=Paractinoplanes aksuensis TaxID=2939490 RepID=A0ABT1DM26_9ACTN|nr:alpha/beta hydrolase [Actinoplanes aksuensis]MCO8271131.1 alpha/beta hydrolase [Actinoplanes aksuensis]
MLLTTEDGTRLAANRTGDGPPVVLVHGSAGGLDSWEPVVPFLRERFELWTYARRGYAPSGECARPKTFADDVGDLRTVIEAAGGTAHVVGTSYGATVALHAGLASAGIRSLVAFEPPLFSAGPALIGVLSRYRALLDGGDLVGAARLLAAEVARVPAAILPAVAAPPESEAIGCLHDLEAMTADTTDLARWAGIAVPTLLLQGSDTWPPMPDTMEALAAALPSAARTILRGQSHFASHTGPEQFAAALIDFLPKHD